MNGKIPTSALLYIPGMASIEADETAGVARRLARALDHGARSSSATFRVEQRLEKLDPGAPARPIWRILREEKGQDVAAIDVIEVGVAASVLGSFEAMSLGRKSVHIAGVLVIEAWRAMGFLFRGAWKSARERMALLWACSFFVYLILYLATLLLTLARALAGALGWKPGESGFADARGWVGENLPGWAAGVGGAAIGGASWLWAHSAEIVALITVIGISLPAFTRGLSRGASIMLCFTTYVETGERAASCVGRLTRLLNIIADQPDRYDRVDVMTYSFGGIVAVDALFPGEYETPEPRLASVTTLATVGVPCDLIRSFWRHYYDKRRDATGGNLRWLNVVRPLDLLGSRFGEDPDARRPSPARGPADAKIENIVYSPHGSSEKLGLGAIVMMRGVQAHMQYWEPDDPDARDCFTVLAPKLYEGQAILA